MKEMFFNMVKVIIGMAVLIIILVGVCYLEKKHDEKIYNNGVCTECGGHYEYSQLVRNGTASTKSYIYRCDKCHKIIELSSYYR